MAVISQTQERDEVFPLAWRVQSGNYSTTTNRQLTFVTALDRSCGHTSFGGMDDQHAKAGATVDLPRLSHLPQQHVQCEFLSSPSSPLAPACPFLSHHTHTNVNVDISGFGKNGGTTQDSWTTFSSTMGHLIPAPGYLVSESMIEWERSRRAWRR